MLLGYKECNQVLLCRNLMTVFHFDPSCRPPIINLEGTVKTETVYDDLLLILYFRVFILYFIGIIFRFTPVGVIFPRMYELD